MSRRRRAAVPESPETAALRARLKAARLAPSKRQGVRERSVDEPQVKQYRVCHPRLVYGKPGDVVDLPDTDATRELVNNGSIVPVAEKAATVKAEPEQEASDG